MAPMMNRQMQRGVDREIRKAGQLHGQDRRDYKAAQEAGRGKSFMRRFQNDAQQMQQGIAKEAAPLGYQPQQQPRPQPQQRPWSPGNTGGGDMLQQLVESGGQPFRPLTGGGQSVDPGRQVGKDELGMNLWDNNNSTNYPSWLGPQAGASVNGYPGVVNDMMNGGAKPIGMANAFRRPWTPNQRSQTRSPGIGLDGQRINYGRR